MPNEWRFGPGGKIPRHIKTAARKAFTGASVGTLLRTVQRTREQYSRAATHIPGAAQLTSAYRRGGLKGFARAVSGPTYQSTWTAVERYAREGGRQVVSDLLRELGPIGSILGAIVGHDTGGGKKPTLPSDLRYALDLIGAFADQPSVINALQRILEGRGAQVTWPSSGTSPPSSSSAPSSVPSSHPASDLAGQIADAINSANQPDEPEPIQPRRLSDSRGGEVAIDIGFGSKKVPPNHPVVTGQMIETPESSNVYSFGYDLQTHSLFVRFKASIHEGGGGYGKGSDYGGGHGRGRPHRPGALYLYHNVPPELFLAFIDAPSKGNWLWDNIRIRGTHSGHRFDYALVGVQNGYVPRKATLTPAGEVFTPRTIFTDKGRRLESSLPELLVRPLMPGRPPNDGRYGLGGGLGGRR